MHHTEGRPAHWSGLERCASIWACPVCSAVIRAERSREVQHAADWWTAQGGSTLMVTLTLRHRLPDPLVVGLEAVVSGWRKLAQQRVWRALKARARIAGYVRSVEVTWTPQNGWHPHVHALLLVESAMSAAEVETLEATLSDAWCRIVVDLGARRPSAEHGVRITRGSADYLAKIQEHDRAGVEMTRFDLKRSRAAHGLMPFELLDVAGPDRARARRLWWEYFDATSGRRAITWSNGLKARAGVDDRDDDQVMDETETSDLVLLVPADQYDALLRNKPGRSTAVLDLVETHDLATASRIAGGTVVGSRGATTALAGSPGGGAEAAVDPRPAHAATPTRARSQG